MRFIVYLGEEAVSELFDSLLGVKKFAKDCGDQISQLRIEGYSNGLPICKYEYRPSDKDGDNWVLTEPA